MKAQFIPIDQAGRIVLPKSIRDELAIKPGDLLTVTIDGASVTLARKDQQPAGFRRKGKALVFMSGSDQTLDHDTVNTILEQTRHDRTEVDPYSLRFKAGAL